MNPTSGERLTTHRIGCAHGAMSWCEAGAGPALVLLHGIGSGARSWQAQIDAFATTHRVIAWDAPGYGDSAPLPQAQPRAADYALALGDFLQRLGVQTLSLVGHSLGALMAAAWAAAAAATPTPTPAIRLRSLLLASPARGYASAAANIREAKFRDRVDMLGRLGVQGLAAQRAAHLCAPGASAAVVEQVRANMARITPGGYAQAAWMLSNDDLATHLARVAAPAAVFCGELDSVTPPDVCKRLATDHGLPYIALPGVGHACYVEDPALFNTALRAHLERTEGSAHE